MILGLGIDIVETGRIKRLLDKACFLKKAFHSLELEESFKKKVSAHLSLAARWACKEALGKALGTGLKGMRLNDIAVLNCPCEKPEIRLFGSALEAVRRRGVSHIHVSLTHEKKRRRLWLYWKKPKTPAERLHYTGHAKRPPKGLLALKSFKQVKKVINKGLFLVDIFFYLCYKGLRI